MLICLDAGHGGSDPGAVGKNPFTLLEKQVTLKACQFLEKEFIKKGHKVIQTRAGDSSVNLLSRTNLANDKKADLFISLHCNSFAGEKAEGIETWIYPGSKTKTYAKKVQDTLIKAFPDHKNRGVKEYNFHVLRETKMPAILIEMEFISNPNQLQFLSKDENLIKIAETIASVSLK